MPPSSGGLEVVVDVDERAQVITPGTSVANYSIKVIIWQVF